MQKNTLDKAKKYINTLLTPLENHYYHKYEHALDVMERAMYLWEKEWLEKDEIEMLALAWLFHDSWFVIQYDDNEMLWAKIAKNYLRSILYPEDKIELIEELIIATDPAYKSPKNILEKIIKDADLDNLWREDFFEKANNLRKEIEIIKNIKIKDSKWRHWLVDVLYDNNIYTETQKKERQDKKDENKKIAKNATIQISWEEENKLTIEL